MEEEAMDEDLVYDRLDYTISSLVTSVLEENNTSFRTRHEPKL
jgi:hypothetical protein